MNLDGAGLAQHLHDLTGRVAATIESSTTISRLPATTSGRGLNFSRRPWRRSSWPGWMNVLAT